MGSWSHAGMLQAQLDHLKYKLVRMTTERDNLKDAIEMMGYEIVESSEHAVILSPKITEREGA